MFVYKKKVVILQSQNEKMSFCGGIGRRARLKIWCPQGLKGSSPFRSTKRYKVQKYAEPYIFLYIPHYHSR